MGPEFKAKEIKQTKTVGQRLKAARLRKQLSLDETERLTKVKLKYLEALEEDRHDLLPTEVYSLGFLRCYGEVLGLNTTKLLDQYRRERQAVKSAKVDSAQAALAPARRLVGPRFLVTPRTLITVGSIVIVLSLLLYIALGIKSFTAPPSLRIDTPDMESRTSQPTLTVSGQTDPGVTLTINGEQITVDQAGKFNHDIAVAPGLSTLEFVVTNRLGKEARAARKVLADYQVSTAAPSPSATSTAEITPSPSAAAVPTASPSVSAQPKRE